MATLPTKFIQGKGLVPISVKENAIGFTVRSGDTDVKLNLVEGTLSLGSTVKLMAPPGDLLWFRRMEIQMATEDKNDNCSPQCLFYGLGMGDTCMAKIHEDGRVELL